MEISFVVKFIVVWQKRFWLHSGRQEFCFLQSWSRFSILENQRRIVFSCSSVFIWVDFGISNTEVDVSIKKYIAICNSYSRYCLQANNLQHIIQEMQQDWLPLLSLHQP